MMFNSVGKTDNLSHIQINPANSILIAFRILAKGKPEDWANQYLENVLYWSMRGYETHSSQIEVIHARRVFEKLATFMLADTPDSEANYARNVASKMVEVYG